MEFEPGLPGPAHLPSAPRLPPLTLCVLTSSPTVMYTTGLATATMSEYTHPSQSALLALARGRLGR